MYRTSSQLVDDVIATIDVKCPTRDGAGRRHAQGKWWRRLRRDQTLLLARADEVNE